MWADLEPDPLFVRRLRSEAVNRFVSVREGIALPAGDDRAHPAMGRLGRACLYASFALGVSPTSVLAVNHPRMPSGLGYFEMVGFDPKSGKIPPNMRTDFDVLEVALVVHADLHERHGLRAPRREGRVVHVEVEVPLVRHLAAVPCVELAKGGFHGRDSTGAARSPFQP